MKITFRPNVFSSMWLQWIKCSKKDTKCQKIHKKWSTLLECYFKSSEARWWFCVRNRPKCKLLVSRTAEAMSFEWWQNFNFWLNYQFKMASVAVFMYLCVISSVSDSLNRNWQCSKGWRLSVVWTVTGLYKCLTGVWVEVRECSVSLCVYGETIGPEH